MADENNHVYPGHQIALNVKLINFGEAEVASYLWTIPEDAFSEYTLGPESPAKVEPPKKVEEKNKKTINFFFSKKGDQTPVSVVVTLKTGETPDDTANFAVQIPEIEYKEVQADGKSPIFGRVINAEVGGIEMIPPNGDKPAPISEVNRIVGLWNAKHPNDNKIASPGILFGAILKSPPAGGGHL